MPATKRCGRTSSVIMTAAVAVQCFASAGLWAAVPAPPNDTPGTAAAITTIPAVVTGSNVNGDNTINSTTLGGLSLVPGPDVFYTFTPTTTGDYWIMMVPWIQTPVYGSSGIGLPEPNLCVYVREVGSGTFVAGSNANGRDIPDTVVATLTASTTYEIVIDSAELETRRQAFEFTLIVAAAPSGSAEDCAADAMISNTLPSAAVNTLTGAIDDFTFTEGSGRCDVANTSGLNVAGPDHVYHFKTGPNPSDAGDYVISLIAAGSVWNGYIYVADSCPPFLPLGCLGAASNVAFTPPHYESIVVTLDFDKDYYIVVDSATLTLPDAKYALLIDRAGQHDITEIEPNNTSGTATGLTSAITDGGQIMGPADIDFWSLSVAAGDRLYALLDIGNTLLTSIDGELRLINSDGIAVLELDDDDGEGASSPWADRTLRTSARSAVIAGAPVPANGTYFLRVDASTTADAITRYRLHAAVEPANRIPTPECEPNDTAPAADGGAKAFFAGTILTQGDVDMYAFSATAGERVLVFLDGDPERDSGGDAADDPLSLDGGLAIRDPAGDVLFSDCDDKSGVEAGQVPDYPGEAIWFTAPTTGTYTLEVSGGDLNDFGAGRTYHLAIFRNETAPALADVRDPQIDSVTPNFANDTLAVVASDSQAGDGGICAVALSASSNNLVISNLSFTPGDPSVNFTVGLINPSQSGDGKIIVTDCAGNTTCRYVLIDATNPSCTGSTVSSNRRTYRSTHAPIHAPDNQPSGPGIDGTISVPDSGTISDVNVTVWIETLSAPDCDVFLESPLGTRVELVTDRGGTGAVDITNATFDDSAASIMSALSADAPYTGTWRPEDPLLLAQLNGQNCLGTWKLNLRDDSASSSTVGGGSRLVKWSLDIAAGFPNPQEYQGMASDAQGINSVALAGANNVSLTLPPSFDPGDTSVSFTINLVNPALNGSCFVVVTDTSDNVCQQFVSLNGLTDSNNPSNSGSVSRNIVIGAEVLATVPAAVPAGVVSTQQVTEPITVGDVTVDITVDTLDVGRIASTLTHAGRFASLVNRVGMTERGSVGLTKDNIEITLDDDAPVADDAHLEPALGTIEFLGLHQPDGRGQFIGDGISSDHRDNMLFALAGTTSTGPWDLYVADFRLQGASSVKAFFRRWRATIESPGGPERYVGTARDPYPGAGICSIAVGGGSTNLAVSSTFTAGDDDATYTVTLVNPSQPGSGTVEVMDCAGNTTVVPINLAAALADQSLPVVTGLTDSGTHLFNGHATDNQPGDSGITSVTLAPHSTNLQIVSVTPNPPNGAGAVDFVVGLINPAANGRGYVRVTDQTGYRGHILVEIDVVAPLCSGSVNTDKRYRSGPDLPAALPDNNPGGVLSSIVVPDLDIISDVNVTLNITHPFDDDIDASLTNPIPVVLFNDIGSTGNDFIHTTIDDEAGAPIPDSASSAPFTGSFQPQGGPALFVLDGVPAAGTYTLKIADDAVFNEGTFESWSITISSNTFPQRYAGLARDIESLGSGIESIELLPGACNLTLTVDPFTPGAKLVVFEVRLTNPAGCGRGMVRVRDRTGNVCDQVVTLNGAFCTPGDVDHNGVVDTNDVDDFVQLLLFSGDNCEADVNGDGKVDGLDEQPFVDALIP